jgi:hypothetical protein
MDRDFDARLCEIELGVPVWIVDTPANKPYVDKRWTTEKNPNHLIGVTTFPDLPAASSEETLIGKLETLDFALRLLFFESPYTLLEVIGTPITLRIKNEFGQFGFNDFRETPNGFEAPRPLPSD